MIKHRIVLENYNVECGLDYDDKHKLNTYVVWINEEQYTDIIGVIERTYKLNGRQYT